MGISVREVAAAVGDVQRASVLSLQELPGETMDFLVSGRAPDPEEQALLREQVRYLHDAVDALPKRLRTIVVQCFFEDRPMVETADELGVSENRAGRLRHQALGLLRDGINSQLDPEMLPEQEPATGGSAARRRTAYYAEIASKNVTRNRGAGADPEASHLRNPR